MTNTRWFRGYKVHVEGCDNGFLVKTFGRYASDPQEIYVAVDHRDVLDIIDNLLRPNGAADELPASAEDNKENV